MRRINQLLAGLEWRWSLGNLLWGFTTASSFALPAWGAKMTGFLEQYAPASWIAAGFLGLLVFAASMALYAFARIKLVRAKYDEKFLAHTGGVDPLSKVFEKKRIFLNDFILPSYPHVNGKTFVDCEIVGPANIFLDYNNKINELMNVPIDAVALRQGSSFYNGFIFTHCTFRGCSFHRVTLFFRMWEARENKDLAWLNWISDFSPEGDLLSAQVVEENLPPPSLEPPA